MSYGICVNVKENSSRKFNIDVLSYDKNKKLCTEKKINGENRKKKHKQF